MLRRWVSAGVVGLAVASLAHADPLARGWFWYQEPPPPPASAPKKPKPLPKPVVVAPPVKPEPPKPAASGPAPLSVEWLRKELPVYRDRAIDDPTPEHVAQYLALQKVMFDKAQNFAQASVKARELYPGLSQATFTPFDANSLQNTKYYEQELRPYAFKQIFAKAGLMFFFDSTCQFCLGQWRQLVSFHAIHPDAAVMAISGDGKPMPGVKMDWVPDNGISKTFHVQLFPTVALVWPPNHVALISQGEMNISGLESGILNAAVDHGLVPKSYDRWIHPFEQGVLTPLDLNDLAGKPQVTPQNLLTGINTQSLKQYDAMDQPTSP